MLPKIHLEHVAVDRAAIIEGTPHVLRILSDVQLSVPVGGRLALFGPSGAGKTSLLRLLNRLAEPAEGRVLLDGEDIRRHDPITLRRRVGMLFQQPFLFDMTVEENLGYPLSLQRQTLPHARAEALLAEFGLPAEFLSRKGQQLSGGQQQRIALARALALDPEVLLLDEPTSALDEESARVMMDALLQRNAARGLTLIMITHSPEMLRRLDCPAVMVHQGRADLFPDAESALREADRVAGGEERAAELLTLRNP